MGEVHRQPGRGDRGVLRRLRATVPGQRPADLRRKPAGGRDDRVADGQGVPAGQRHQDEEARHPLDQGRDGGLAVLADDQVPFPVPGDLASLYLGGALVDVDRLADPRRRWRTPPALRGLPAGAQADQLPAQGGHRLGVHPLVDRHVNTRQDYVGGVLGRRPTIESGRPAVEPQARQTTPPAAAASALPRRSIDRSPRHTLPRRGRGPVPLTAAVQGATSREFTDESATEP